METKDTKPWEEKLDTILYGIDKDECEDVSGWWETSEGKGFGAEKLQEVKTLFRETLESEIASAKEEEGERIRLALLERYKNPPKDGRNQAVFNDGWGLFWAGVNNIIFNREDS